MPVLGGGGGGPVSIQAGSVASTNQGSTGQNVTISAVSSVDKCVVYAAGQGQRNYSYQGWALTTRAYLSDTTTLVIVDNAYGVNGSFGGTYNWQVVEWP